MANLNRIILVGRLTADTELRSTNDGLPVAKFRLAVERPASGRGENGADFIDVVAWRELAEACGHLKKGNLVLVEGRIQNRSFEDQSGQRRWVTEVVAKSMTKLDQSTVVGQQSTVAAGLKTEDSGPTTDDEVVDDSGLESELPF